MDIKTLSTERGITAIIDPDTIYIYSSFYGLVAKGDIVRHYDNPEKYYDLTSMSITFNICKWYGCWSLQAVIKRGLNKLYSVPIQYTFNETKGESHLKGHLQITYIEE